MITLKAMLKHKKMNSNIVIYFFKSLYLTFSNNFSFTYFKTLLNLLHKTKIFVLNITFFKNYCCYFMRLCFGFIYTRQWNLTIIGHTTICPISDSWIPTIFLSYCLRILCRMKRITLSWCIRILGYLWNINYS